MQACGDAHLCNFGAFATPERRAIFDINDLDETLPAPWEWDVKRLAASIVVASRSNGFSEDDARDAALACVRSYRERMAEFSEMRTLDVWYARVDLEQLQETIQDKEARQRSRKALAKARERSTLEHDFPKLAALAGAEPRIKDNPPLIYHPGDEARDDMLARVRGAFADYRESVQEDRRVLLDRFDLKDVAIKVVGVGSVGTTCAVILLMASEADPLFLQVKEARTSVLEPYAGASTFSNRGQRVVNGIRLMQSASDIFLGWTTGQGWAPLLCPPASRPENERPGGGVHARGNGPVRRGVRLEPGPGSCPIGGTRAHLGLPRQERRLRQRPSQTFRSAYADQTEADHETLMKAVRAGRLEVVTEEA